MTREVRANVIFLLVLFFLAAPGFGLLMYRKLHGTARPNDLPEAVSVSTAYMQPLPVDPRLPRREPRVVRDWVRQLLQAREGPDVKVMRDGEGEAAGPLVSDRFVTQLAGMSADADGSLKLVLVRWDAKTDLATEQPKLFAETNGHRVDGKILLTESTEVPREVRYALQDVGYIDPPARVWWITATLPKSAANPPPDSITLQYRITGIDAPETIRLSPGPATRP